MIDNYNKRFIGFLVYEEFLVKCVVHDIIERRHLANKLSSLLITNTQEYMYVVVHGHIYE